MKINVLGVKLKVLSVLISRSQRMTNSNLSTTYRETAKKLGVIYLFGRWV